MTLGPSLGQGSIRTLMLGQAALRIAWGHV